VFFKAEGKTLTLTGNLFYENDPSLYRIRPVYNIYGTVIASYNVVDVSSLVAGSPVISTGYVSIGTAFADLPVSPKTFKLLDGSGALAKLPASLPSGYPTQDFYGNAIGGTSRAAGAVQAYTANGSGYYYLDLSVNNSQWGDVDVYPAPDGDGLVSGSLSFPASPNPGYSVYWRVGGALAATAPASLSAHTRVQALFYKPSTVTGITYNSVSGGTCPWTLESDGRRKSPTISSGTVTRARVNFTSTAPNQDITIQLDVSSAIDNDDYINYDGAFISNLDTADATTTSDDYWSISDTQSVTVRIPVPDVGTHFVDIGYQRGGMNFADSDCAWFKVLP
jgi:hypothetical protein